MSLGQAGRLGWFGRLGRISSVGLVLLLAGCLAGPVPARLDIEAPGWTVRQGQAVWTMPERGLDLAGELLVALHTNGTCLVQFTKSPLPWITAERRPDWWRLHHHAAGRTWQGKGTPPTDQAWLTLAGCLGALPAPPPWRFEETPEGRWRLGREDTGESLHGYLDPPATRPNE